MIQRGKPWPVLLLAQHLSEGGSERQLAETAISLDRSEFAPHVGCLRPGGFREEELRRAGVPVVCFAMRSFLSVSAAAGAIGMLRYLRRHHIQLVHAFDVPMDVFAVPVARAARTPVVLSSQRAHRELTKGLLRPALRIVDRLADGIIVNSNALRRRLIEDEKVPPGRIYLCHNGIDTDLFHPGNRDLRADKPLVIGSVCVLRPEKSLGTLLEAFARLRPQESGLTLRITGDGPARQELEALGRRLSLQDQFRLEPATSKVAERLREIDIFVLPSLSESFSNSLMEAMACGCATIASRTGGNPELVQGGETGLLFETGNVRELADQLRRLVDDASLRLRLGASASSFVRGRFSRQRAVDNVAAVYRKFLQAKSEPAAASDEQ
ncbi:MAG: glycosyltransferase family 4 protein [Acidobacteria bacterium]|nr:glycosyltransferase family 4 protein [Acidobacteriota bacterium]